jgi:hypothetical protein
MLRPQEQNTVTDTLIPTPMAVPAQEPVLPKSARVASVGLIRARLGRSVQPFVQRRPGIRYATGTRTLGGNHDRALGFG